MPSNGNSGSQRLILSGSSRLNERLSLPANREQEAQRQVLSGSSRLQDIEIQYFEDTMQPLFQDITSNSKASGSRPPGVLSQTLVDDRSPIRSLNEDRVHVSLRLGPLPIDDPMAEEELPTLRPTTRSTTRKKTGRNIQQKKRVGNSPLHGVSLKKRRMSKIQNSPNSRRSLQVEQEPTGHTGNTVGNTSTRPSTTLIPAIKKRGKDFRLPSDDLP